MSPSSEADVTQLLRRLNAGDGDANQQFYALVYDELRRLAHHYMRGERRGHTLQTTALVNEAFLRLMPKTAIDWQDRGHFFKAAAGTMRAILVDHARKRKRVKRGAGAERVPLDDVLHAYEQQSLDVIELDEALGKLGEVDAQLRQITELRYFTGLTVDEVATVLETSKSTVERGWATARAWMKLELGK